MKIINLTQRKLTIVDDEDFERLNQHKWTYIRDNKSGHAYRQSKGKTIYMHREIMAAKPGQIVDHINFDGLDNRKINLRFVNARQNVINKAPQSNNHSGYSGIHWDRINHRWMVRVKMYGKSKMLGRYINIKDAIKARKDGEIKFGYKI